MSTFNISGNIVDIAHKWIFPGTVCVEKGKVKSIDRDKSGKEYDNYLMPGFIDSHVHIESSMMAPSEFARMASVHGTVASVSDPHEIANVLGVEGVHFMIENAKQVPFKIYFGASPCVPATPFESSGAALGAGEIRELFEKEDLKYLSEMMNYPGVLNSFPDVMEKIAIAQDYGVPVDGHSPGLRGKDAEKYISAGISTDHECTSLEEAIDKIYYGMKISIREGSAAKNYDALHKLVEVRPEMCMFCSDDKHPDDLVKSHIDQLVRRSVEKGYNLFRVLRVATKTPIDHYGLDVGMLRPGDDADFIEVNNLEEFKVLKTFIKGELVAENGKTLMKSIRITPINKFVASPKKPEDFRVEAKGGMIRVIDAADGQLLTGEVHTDPKIENGNLVSDTENDILKITVINRYEDAPPAIGFIMNFGLKSGAIASSVAHDSHNIIAVGTGDEEICKAVNAIIEAKGGIAAVDGDVINVLPLPLAGIMSDDDGFTVAQKYTEIDKKARDLGSSLSAPFMTLSFMALLVIPSLKLSDKGLFDGTKFEFTKLQVQD